MTEYYDWHPEELVIKKTRKPERVISFVRRNGGPIFGGFAIGALIVGSALGGKEKEPEVVACRVEAVANPIKAVEQFDAFLEAGVPSASSDLLETVLRQESTTNLMPIKCEVLAEAGDSKPVTINLVPGETSTQYVSDRGGILVLISTD